jgi:hypothetical protein
MDCLLIFTETEEIFFHNTLQKSEEFVLLALAEKHQETCLIQE